MCKICANFVRADHHAVPAAKRSRAVFFAIANRSRFS
jgi:hypothetical protein